jgi:hypothetical protein
VLYKFYRVFDVWEFSSNLDDSSKLFLYSKLKTDIKLEDYLKLTKKINNRQLLTKFKTNDHPLEIELGRCKKIPRHQRLCKTCKALDDEILFFLYFCDKGVPCINIFITYIFIYIKCFLNKGVYSIRLNPGIVEHNLCFYK